MYLYNYNLQMSFKYEINSVLTDRKHGLIFTIDAGAIPEIALLILLQL